ncbi:hypothetical protein [Streptomyces sp. NPDC058086]|uniref:hypothetical protein n=1 Tax=Streptomyces sp. NPDC058086 TaxID=3346334 RepID=UPI0036E7AA17
MRDKIRRGIVTSVCTGIGLATAAACGSSEPAIDPSTWSPSPSPTTIAAPGYR